MRDCTDGELVDDVERQSSCRMTLRAVVAIPVRNEEQRIARCLHALRGQVGVDSYGIVLVLNNCTDGTEAAVGSIGDDGRCSLQMLVRNHPDASAGWARREAMNAAADWLAQSGKDGVLLTTDADTVVGSDWIARNIAALQTGVDLVAGRFVLDAVEAKNLPPSLHYRGRLEAAYEAQATEIWSRINPRAEDPWPHHNVESGASLAVWVSAYRAVDGIPALALGEDRAFVSTLRSRGMRVRHAPDIVVVTSGRLDGRAEGGAADTMKRRCMEPEAACDDALRPALRLLLDALSARYSWSRMAGLIFPPRTLVALRPRQLPRQIIIARVIIANLRSFAQIQSAFGYAIGLARRDTASSAKRVTGYCLKLSRRVAVKLRQATRMRTAPP